VYSTVTMSSNLPLRTIRIPVLRQQCLWQQRCHAQSSRAFSTSTPQAFASSHPRSRGGSSVKQDKAMTKAAVKSQVGSAPKVTEMKAQQEGAMAEDIGLLQDTIVRAAWAKLPKVWSTHFWSYMWKLLKSKGTGLYSYVEGWVSLWCRGIKSLTNATEDQCTNAAYTKRGCRVTFLSMHSTTAISKIGRPSCIPSYI
jgi:hypothetical protein